MNTIEKEYCIVGGSPVGLTLALLLSKQGGKVSVLERNKDFNNKNGGVILQSKTLELFAQLGILSDLEKVSEKILSVGEYIYQEPLFEKDYSSYTDLKYPFALSISNANLQKIILSIVKAEENITLYPDTSIQELRESSPDKYEVIAKIDGELNTFKPDLIFACDGKFSETRKKANIHAEIKEFEQVSVIMKIERPKGWPSKLKLYHGKSSLFIIPLKDSFMYLIYLKNKEELDKLKNASINTLLNELINIEPELNEPLSNIKDWNNVLSIPFFSVKSDKWSNKNVLLVGDSAHAVHVYGGQGMNMAFLDSVILANLCEKAQETKEYHSIGDNYEKIRKPYIAQFQIKQQLYLENNMNNNAKKSLYADNFEAIVMGQKSENSTVIN
ncbi:FAD-dependent oxidoreductase [Bacillus cereus]|uniref:FAD-dependent oxidoreductase n=1 Tax=Bacillus cereus TaxID=1396 RepID=UPI003D647176